MVIISVLAVLSAIAATVLAFIFIVPEKKRAKLNKIGKLAHDIVNFKFLIIEKILQALYIFSTAFVILTGFFMFFYVEEGYHGAYYSSPDVWYGGYGLLTIILGPIIIRLIYEGSMMLILLVKNVIQINSKLKAPEGVQEIQPFSVPFGKSEPAAAEAPAAPADSAPAFCPNCGAAVAGAFCPVCGTKVQ